MAAGDYADSSKIAEQLKYNYDTRSIELINKVARTMKKLKTSTDIPTGKGFMLGIKTAASYGIGVRDEGKALPTPSYEEMQNPIITTKNFYAVVKMTGQAIALTKNFPGAFEKVKEDSMESIIKTYHKLNNYHFFRDGYSTLAVVHSDGATGTVITCTAPEGSYHMKRGMIIDSVNASGTTTSDTDMVVASYDHSARTVTVDNSGSVVATNELVLAGDRDNTAQKHITGLKTICAESGTYFGPNRGTYQEWAGNTMGNATVLRPLTIELMQTALDAIEFDTGEETPEVEIIVNQGVRRKYMLLLHPQKRLVNTQELKGGYASLDFNGIEVRCDTDCPRREMYFVDWSTLYRYQLQPGGWGDEGGKWFSLSGASTPIDAITSFWREYFDVGCPKPKFNCRMYDITE